MLVFKKNIYYHPLDAYNDATPDLPYGGDEAPQPVAFHLIHRALETSHDVVEELHQLDSETGMDRSRVLFPHATRFGGLSVLNTLSRNLREGLVDTHRWQLMNCYHFCYLYDALQEIVEDYSYGNGERRLELIPELRGEPLNFNHFLNQYFFHTAFLIAPKRFNSMSPEERRRLGKLDHAYFGAVLPPDNPDKPEDPTLSRVINAAPPEPNELALAESSGNPYAPNAPSL